MMKVPTGIFDVLPDEQAFWDNVENIFQGVASSFGFEKIKTSFWEDKNLYQNRFQDIERAHTNEKNQVVLRPDFIFSLIRAYNEHGLYRNIHPLKLFYVGPTFDPNETHRIGLEMLGVDSAFSDAFLIGLIKTVYEKLGLIDIIFQVNSVGCSSCQNKIKKALTNYYSDYLRSICPACQTLFSQNPLKLLSCRHEGCQEIQTQSPALTEFLCDHCKSNFKEVLEYLDDLEVPYDFNPRLVGHSNYFSKTVFDVHHDGNDLSLGNGGRHDALFKNLSGQQNGAIGFTSKIKNIIKQLKQRNVGLNRQPKPILYLIHLGNLAKKKSLPILFHLHDSGFRIYSSHYADNLKTQLENAQEIGSSYALILGQREAKENSIIVRDMLDGSQETVDDHKLLDFLKKRLGGALKIKKME